MSKGNSRVALYCTCGDSATGTIKPEAKAAKFRAMWLSVHAGPGHAPCDQKTAARARAKADQQEVAR